MSVVVAAPDDPGLLSSGVSGDVAELGDESGDSICSSSCTPDDDAGEFL